MQYIRRVTRFFRSKDVEVPYEEEPIPQYEHIEGFDEQLAEAHVYNRRLRHGPGEFSYWNLKNARRVMQYVGDNGTLVEVPQGKQLVAEVIIVHPTRGKYEATVFYKSGEQFDAATFNSKVAASIGDEIKDVERKSSFVAQCVIKSAFYLRHYEPIPGVR